MPMVLTGAYCPEGLFFGDGYSYQVVPLSYDPPCTPEALERLKLDALWLETLGGCGTVIFCREFTPPLPATDRNWRASDSYDVDFTRAYDESTLWVDNRPTLVVVAEASSWVVGLRHPRGVWLVRGEGVRIDVSSVCPG